MRFGKLIKAARKAAKKTQKQLAESIGRSTSSIQKYELNLVTPPIETLQKICEVLGVSFVDVITQELLYEDD